MAPNQNLLQAGFDPAEAIQYGIGQITRPFGSRPVDPPARAGADYIDVNAGTFLAQKAEKLAWIIDAVQAVTDVPLSLDSASPDVLESVLPKIRPRPMINSITLEPGRLSRILSLALEAKAMLVALC